MEHEIQLTENEINTQFFTRSEMEVPADIKDLPRLRKYEQELTIYRDKQSTHFFTERRKSQEVVPMGLTKYAMLTKEIEQVRVQIGLIERAIVEKSMRKNVIN